MKGYYSKCYWIDVLKNNFFNLKLSPLVTEVVSTFNKYSNDGSKPVNIF